MSQIYNGEIIYNDMSKNAHGGTELIMDRMVKYIPKEYMEGWQIIHSRPPEELDTDKRIMLVFHDLPNDPCYDKLKDESYRDKIDLFVFVSNWQLQYFNLSMGIPYSKSVVIQNGIEPFAIRTDVLEPPEKTKLIYHTTPHRGLEILIPVFNELLKTHSDIELDIYSSFEIYGWGERDIKYKHLFDMAKENPHINYHGFQPNEKVRTALTESHIFAYPSTWPETSCLAAIEALAAGLYVVNPNYAALPETCGFFGSNYQWSENSNQHATVFYRELHNTIEYIRKYGMSSRILQQNLYNTFYKFDGEFIKNKWVTALTTRKYQ